MSVVNTGRSVMDMLNELLSDLNRDDLVLVERLPYVREYERYRDVITNILREFHIALVLVRVTFTDGSRKGYVFLIRGEGGELGKIPTTGVVEGYVVTIKGNDRRKFVYNPARFDRAEDVGARIIEFANMYRKAEERISQLQLMREAEKDYALFYEEAGD
ncbi:MAG: hypothetical protein RXN89_02295 [Vulcanisaeta sp.]|jgi:hypothetical protein|uniref:hypothetical protein n=1 Tax=Vulcanisaeta sp. EB80 TaxID=1650660 RepID=UPI0007484771|nr:hypothetical protein [Vulcanisaeta sp. EB80]KUO81823.1 MAG: hypothetical protein AT714_02070 [Vulcanisaeta sp. OSP_8]KUO89238.1 MAG: hypothetical protein AT716_00430 [Vulcanisaeta sp. MG_3]KUO94519.1 MAG: hypothetical protein AT717_05925 [Vulcanisaeta sp. CIS_19]MCG2865152.1 hypothetical protein [Vulcanisaeta sp.]MCG2866744.1 hypothetical protein [Vulcanisaeta sp.]